MNRKFYYILFILVLCFSGATYDEILQDKRKQIEINNQSIVELKSLHAKNDKQIFEIKKQIDSLQNEIDSREEFLKYYKDQDFLSPDEIITETNNVIYLSREIEALQNNFRNKVVSLYKHGKNYELELLLSAKTPNEFLRRNQYLQKFTQNRKKELGELKTKRFLIDEKKKLLSLSTSSQRFHVESRRREQAILNNDITELNKGLKKIEDAINSISEKVKLKEYQNKSLRNYIINLQEKRQTYTSVKSSRINYPTDNIERLKGIINLPLDYAVVTNYFGNKYNIYSGLRSFNNGIDLSIARDSKVYAVAKGTISLISDIPYYGKTIIIDHGNGFRTLYAKLNKINAEPGEKVKNGQVIGSSGENEEGQGLHFELWQGKTPLNPAIWMNIK